MLCIYCHRCVTTYSTGLYVHVQGLAGLGHNQYTRYLFIQASEHPICGARFGENCKTTKPSSGWYILVHEEQYAMDRLPNIPHILWVHGQGLTSLGHSQYTRIMFIQASEHPSGGTGFGENCKTIMPSLWWLSMLLSEEPHAMDVLPSIRHILWVHGQGLTSLGHDQYTGMLSIQAQKAFKLWDQIWWELQHNHVMLRLVSIVTQRTTCHGYVATHSFCGCMGKVWQAWDTINILWSCSSKPQSTQAVGPYLARTSKQPCHPQIGVCCYMTNHWP